MRSTRRGGWLGGSLAVAAAALLLASCRSAGFSLLNAAAPQVSHQDGIAFGQGERARMDLYWPDSAGGISRPLVVFWYGGSWDSGSRKDYRFVGAALAARGAVVAIPDYQLYPEVKFPVFLQDAARAVAQAQREAGAHGADPRRTVLGGHSAGAYIAAMLALQPVYLRDAGVDPSSIAGFFGLSGPYEINPNTDALRDIFNSVATPAQFQPIAQVDGNAPPALLIHGGKDKVVSPLQSRHLAEALRIKGVQVDLREIPGRSHVDTLSALSRAGRFRIPDELRIVGDFAAALQPHSAPR